MPSYIEIDLCQDLLKYLKIEFLTRIIALKGHENPFVLNKTSIDPVSTLIFYMDQPRIEEYTEEIQYPRYLFERYIHQEMLMITVQKQEDIDFPEMYQYFLLKNNLTSLCIQITGSDLSIRREKSVILRYRCREVAQVRGIFIAIKNTYPYHLIWIKCVGCNPDGSGCFTTHFSSMKKMK